jgi:hypothetical protein
MIREFEKKPIGRYLIDRNDGDPALFLRVKAAEPSSHSPR